MNILLVCSLYRPHVGGIETLVNELSQYYSSLGHTTQILTKQWPTTLAPKILIDNTLVFRVNSPKTTKDFHKWSIWLDNFIRIGGVSPDIIHCIGVRTPLPLLALKMSAHFSVPLICTIAGSEVPEEHDIESQDVWRRGLPIIPEVLRQCTRVNAFSDHLCNNLTKVMPEIHVETLLAGQDTSQYITWTPVNRDKPFILSLRRLIKSKGIDVLIKAFASIHEDYPNLELIIAGDGDQKQLLENLSHSLGVSNKVLFLGSIPLKTGIGLLKTAQATIVPSISEGGGLVNIEAQAVGCPLIASKAGGIPEYAINDRTAILFTPGNSNALAKALRKTFEYPEETSHRVKNGIVFAENFSWNRLGIRYISLYKSLRNEYISRPLKPWSTMTQTFFSSSK